MLAKSPSAKRLRTESLVETREFTIGDYLT